MSVLERLKEFLAPDEGETVLYDIECQECTATFTTTDEPSEAACEECGSTNLEEVSRMYAGGGGGAPG